MADEKNKSRLEKQIEKIFEKISKLEKARDNLLPNTPFELTPFGERGIRPMGTREFRRAKANDKILGHKDKVLQMMEEHMRTMTVENAEKYGEKNVPKLFPSMDKKQVQVKVNQMVSKTLDPKQNSLIKMIDSHRSKDIGNDIEPDISQSDPNPEQPQKTEPELDTSMSPLDEYINRFNIQFGQNRDEIVTDKEKELDWDLDD